MIFLKIITILKNNTKNNILFKLITNITTFFKKCISLKHVSFGMTHAFDTCAKTPLDMSLRCISNQCN